MMELDAALNTAKEFIKSVSQTNGRWQLEEAIFVEAKNAWSITYSFWRENEPISDLPNSGQVIFREGRRVYRTVIVNAENNQVISMKAGFSELQTETA